MTAVHTKPAAHPHLDITLDLAAVLLLPLMEWIDDLTTGQRVTRAVWTVIAVGALVVLLAACQPRDTRPGPVETAVSVAATTQEIQ